MNSLVLFSGTMLANVLNYFFHLAVGRMVSVEVYGEVESLISLVNIISVPAMTLAMVATKFSACSKADCNPGESHEVWKYLNRKVLKFGIPLFLLAVLATPYVADFMKIESWTPFVFIWIMMFLSFFAAVNSGILTGWQKFKGIGLTGVWGAIVKLAAVIILVKAGFALNGAIGSFFLGVLASYIASIVMLRFIISAKETGAEDDVEKKFDFDSLKKYVLPAFLATLVINILGNVDMLLAKHNLDAVAAGQYGALTIVSKIIFYATGVIATVLFSMSAEDSHKNNDSLRIFRNASYLMLSLSAVATLIYFVFPELVLSILFGSKYSDVAGYLGWFAILVTLYSFANLEIQYLLSINSKADASYWMLAISLAAVVSLMFFGTNIYAILGIMIAAQILAIFIGLRYIFKLQKYGSK